MAEIVGVAATAAQLAVTCFSLLDLIKKIRGGTSALKVYNQQLQELRTLSESVSNNPLLQTAEVGLHTQAILTIIEDNCLSSLLQKSRWSRTWGILYREREIIGVFAVLERQKASLSLAIEDTQSRALYQIQSDIKAMADKSSNTRHKLPIRSDRPRRKERLSMSSNSSKAMIPYNARNANNDTTTDDEGILSSSSKATDCNKSVRRRHPSRIPIRTHSRDSESRRKRWVRCKAGDKIDQINGPQAHLYARRGNEREMKPIKSIYTFSDCTKVGRGTQVNGADWIDVGGNYDPHELPDLDSFHTDCTFFPVESRSNRTQGLQINGFRYRRVKESDMDEEEEMDRDNDEEA